MHPLLRIFLMMVILCTTSVAWLVLGAAMDGRTSSQQSGLEGRVADLWGATQRQTAPELVFRWERETENVRQEVENGETREIRETVTEEVLEPQSPSSTRVDVDLALDERRKGLLWYPLYDVGFDGRWTYTHRSERAGRLKIVFPFPDGNSIYDAFVFEVDGRNMAAELRPQEGRVEHWMDIEPGQTVRIHAGYRSRGMTEWRYAPSSGVASLEDFRLVMKTDFDEIDFPEYALSPSAREREGSGYRLTWAFQQIVTGHGIGMVMPTHVQPGLLASEMALSAPISLFFFFLVIQALAFVRKIDIHPINYLFLAAAFFAFHLLFGYTADHLPVEWAFAISSVVSVFLVVSYLRLVVSRRFAFIEAGVSQLVFLVVFSLAHFWEGFTGLTVVALSVVTLFVLMQLTGRFKWSELLATKRPGAPPGPVPSPEPTHDPWVRAER